LTVSRIHLTEKGSKCCRFAQLDHEVATLGRASVRVCPPGLRAASTCLES
jgi:hypothetical protein